MRAPLILGAVLLASRATSSAAQNGMPSQAQTDTQNWSLLSGGVANRPFVVSLTHVPAGGGSPMPVWTAAAGATASPPAGHEATTGQLTAVVSPTNMCSAGQTPAQGVCYNPPNRVAVTLGLTSGNGPIGTDLTGSMLAPGDAVDIVLQMGPAFSGGAFGWAWANGDVQFWNVSTPVAGGPTTLTARLVPVLTPVPDWTSINMQSQCCTCDMPSNCPLARASAFTLAGNFCVQINSVAGSGATPLAGAVFSTKNAVMGGLALSAGNEALSYALASAHAAPDGSLLTGTLAAFVPAHTLSTIFPGVSAAAAATALSVTRTGDPGTQAAIAVAPVAAATFGADGVMINVTGVTFSAPTYQVAMATTAKSAAPALRGTALLATAAAAAMLLL